MYLWVLSEWRLDTLTCNFHCLCDKMVLENFGKIGAFEFNFNALCGIEVGNGDFYVEEIFLACDAVIDDPCLLLHLRVCTIIICFVIVELLFLGTQRNSKKYFYFFLSKQMQTDSN